VNEKCTIGLRASYTNNSKAVLAVMMQSASSGIVPRYGCRKEDLRFARTSMPVNYQPRKLHVHKSNSGMTFAA